jgi:Leucine-rich repeat (LRR) protein
MKTRSHASAPPTLVSLPNDALRQVIAACGYYEGDVPLFETVKGLGCLSKGMRQQLYRLQPLVGVQSLAVVQRSNHGPWRITLLYEGDLTASVEEQARQGRVRSINASLRKLYPAVAERVVPDLLGEGCSLLELDLSGAGLKGSWSAVFGEAALCSAVLRALYLNLCKLSGPLPELRLPALQVLDLSNNQWTGGLEPLQGCTALQRLLASSNELTGTLEPLRGCTGLTELNLAANRLSGSLEPLSRCTGLRQLIMPNNRAMRRGLTGGLEPLRGCTALVSLFLPGNTLTGSLEPLQG